MPATIATGPIVQQAFRALELGRFSSFADDTPQAAAAAEQYPIALDMALEVYDWSFARSVQMLAGVLSLPAGMAADLELPNVFALPEECLQVRRVEPRDARWRVDGAFIRSDAAAPLKVTYTRRLTDESRIPATFCTFVAYQLAELIGPEWQGNEAVLERIGKALAKHRAQAMKNDAQTASLERYDGRDHEPDIVDYALR